jgi:putative polymerase
MKHSPPPSWTEDAGSRELNNSTPALGTANSQFDDRMIIAIVIATVAYQAVLCLLNTHGLTASRTLLGLSEGIILTACLPFISRRLLPGVITIIAISGAMFCLQTLLSGQLNIKTFRDLAIPLCYLWLGCNIGRIDLASRALIYAIWVVLFMGAFELFFVDQYTNFFDIFSYYVNTGNLDPGTTTFTNTKLQINGTRPEGIGRTLLPALLGSHRVSAVFLEPVSLGNFATICAAWGLSLNKSELRKTVFFVITAVVMIVISDSRFALTTVSLMIAMRLIIHGRGLYLSILAPFAAVALLVAMGEDGGKFVSDSFSGRLALSGNALHEFNIPMLFAMTVSNPYADMGYAHLISTFGLPITLLLWFSLWFLPMPDEQGQRFRSFAAIYIVLILCVSGYSLYALKTSGVLWFLMGCCTKNPAPIPQRPSTPQADMMLEPILLDVDNRIRRRTDVY